MVTAPLRLGPMSFSLVTVPLGHRREREQALRTFFRVE